LIGRSLAIIESSKGYLILIVNAIHVFLFSMTFLLVGEFAFLMTESTSVPSLEWSLEYLDVINTEISSVCGESPSGIDGLLLEVISRGHRTRALLTLLWCEALSGDYRAATSVAAAYELAHSAALVEDDIIDESCRKLGRDTLSAKHGVPRAMLVSNTLLFYAPTLIARYSRQKEDPLLVAKLLELLGECGRLTAKGEFMDLEMSLTGEVSEQDYETMIIMKTGALVGAASASGALIGSGKFDRKTVDAAYSFGESLGTAYQIQDDLQDYLGLESQIGKTTFWDFKKGKKSLPLIHCLKVVGDSDRDYINRLLRAEETLSQSDKERLRSLMLKSGSDDYCRKSALKFVRIAEKSLSMIRAESLAKQRLLQVTDYLSHRS
jgi:geranylgeranyl diphosphate synthase, type I